jgi:hypothetical protein
MQSKVERKMIVFFPTVGISLEQFPSEASRDCCFIILMVMIMMMAELGCACLMHCIFLYFKIGI